MSKAIWVFSCRDNGRKFQAIKVTAPTKAEAIELGFRQAKKKAKGDIIDWQCRLERAW